MSAVSSARVRGSKAWKGVTRFAPTTAVAGWSVSSDLRAESLGGDGPAGGRDTQMATQRW